MTFASAPKTVQQRITDELRTRISGMKDVDAINSSDVTLDLWNNRVQGPIAGSSPLMYPLYTLEQGPEETSSILWPHENKICTFYIEFQFQRWLDTDIDVFQIFRYYLGRLQQRLFGNIGNTQLGGLAIAVVETSNQPQIESQSDPSPGGLLTFQVHYRIISGDPYHLTSEASNYG